MAERPSRHKRRPKEGTDNQPVLRVGVNEGLRRSPTFIMRIYIFLINCCALRETISHVALHLHECVYLNVGPDNAALSCVYESQALVTSLVVG